MPPGKKSPPVDRHPARRAPRSGMTASPPQAAGPTPKPEDGFATCRGRGQRSRCRPDSRKSSRLRWLAAVSGAGRSAAGGVEPRAMVRRGSVGSGMEPRGTGMVAVRSRELAAGRAEGVRRGVRAGIRLADRPDFAVFPSTQGCGLRPIRVQESRARSRTTRSTLLREIPADSPHDPDDADESRTTRVTMFRSRPTMRRRDFIRSGLILATGGAVGAGTSARSYARAVGANEPREHRRHRRRWPRLAQPGRRLRPGGAGIRRRPRERHARRRPVRRGPPTRGPTPARRRPRLRRVPGRRQAP